MLLHCISPSCERRPIVAPGSKFRHRPAIPERCRSPIRRAVELNLPQPSESWTSFGYFVLVPFRFLSLHGGSPTAPRRSWAKADNPFWSRHVAAWYRSALDAEDYCRRRDLSTATLIQWARHLLNAQDLRQRTEDLQKSRRKTPERQLKNAPPSGPRGLGEIATAYVRTTVRLRFARSGACMWKQ
jgi:hypothetical protein